MTRDPTTTAADLPPVAIGSYRALRVLSLVGSVTVALSSGSNYGFSSFAPQLQEQLQLTSTQINVVGVAGNMGVYLSGPVWGRLVDRRGPKGALLLGALLVLTGYGGLAACYTGRIPTASPAFLAFLSLLTGLGNSGSFSAAMNAQAKSWGGTRRGSATAVVLAGFGLSAFLYSSASHALFPGNTAGYLTMLSLGSAASFLFGLAVVRIFTPPEAVELELRGVEEDGEESGVGGRGRRWRRSWTRADEATEAEERGDEEEQPWRRRPSLGRSSMGRRRTSSDVAGGAWSQSLLDAEMAQDEREAAAEEAEAEERESEEEERQQAAEAERRSLGQQRQRAHGRTDDESDGENDAAEGQGERQTLLRGGGAGSNGAHNPSSSDDDVAAAVKKSTPSAGPHAQGVAQVDVTGVALFRSVDFLLLFSIMTLVSGTGLLVINNIGTITRTLWEWNRRQGGHHGHGHGHGHGHVHLDPAGQATDDVATTATAVATAAVVRATARVSGRFRRGGVAEPLVADVFGKSESAEVQQLQAHQVSAISLGNASGRIIIGLLSDLLVNQTGDARLRVWLLGAVCLLALGSQSVAAIPDAATTLPRLLGVSASTGLMYGTLFGLCPVLMFEWFGLRHFSQNWGLLSLSPVLAGNVFNLLFGRVYDSHVAKDAPRHVCLEGEECYRFVFEVTAVCAVVATALSAALIARRAGFGRISPLSKLLGAPR